MVKLNSNMLTDMHCHLQDERILTFLPQVLEKAEKVGVDNFLCCGTNESDWQLVLDLHQEFPRIIPAIGIHPWFVNEISTNWREKFINILQENKECNIGEIGLDLYFYKDAIDKQKEILLAQLEIARSYSRPVSIHCLKAFHLLLPIINNFPDVKIMLHSFSGSLKIVEQILDMKNVIISFSTAILGNHKRSLNDIINIIPADRILLETDSPFQLPKSDLILNRDFNEPSNLILVLKKVAEYKNMEVEILRKQIIVNNGNFLGRK